MKKIFAVVAAVAVSSASLFAYNPPFGGEELFRLTNPEMLSGSSSSAAGGPAFNVIPASITYNPALPAGSEILTFDVSGTLFANLDKEDGDKSAGGAFEIGVLYPTSWGTFTATFNSVISELYRMPLGKIYDFHAGAAKDINDWLAVGLNVYYRNYAAIGDGDSDFAVGADLGAFAKVGDLGCFKDARLGASVLNIGKPADYPTMGLDRYEESSKYPSIFTPRVGFAATVVESGSWKAAVSADVSIPSFVNCISDVGVELDYGEALKLNLAWQLNIREFAEGKDGICSCSFGVSYKFGINSGKHSMTPSLASQYLYGGLAAISGGARVDLGQKDTAGAEIQMW